MGKRIRDEIMSTRKQVHIEDVLVPDVPDETPLKGVSVLSLEIEDDDEAGGDPYNHTGSHYVEALRRREDEQD